MSSCGPVVASTVNSWSSPNQPTDCQSRMRRACQELDAECSAADPDVLLRQLVDLALELSGAECAAVAVTEGAALRLAVWKNCESPLDPCLLAVPDNIVARVVQSGEECLVDDGDAPDSPEPLPRMLRGESRSAMAVPLKIGSAVRGVLVAEAVRAHAFDAEQQSLLRVLALRAAMALQNANLLQTTQTRADQLAVLAELGRHAVSDDDLPALMNDALALLAQTLDVEFCEVLELAADGQTALLRAGVGWEPGWADKATQEAQGGSLTQKALQSPDPVVAEGLQDDPQFSLPPRLREHNVASGMSIVIPGRSRPFGVLSVYTTRRRSFTADDGNFLQATANMLAMAIEQERQESELRLMMSSAGCLIWHAEVEGSLQDAQPLRWKFHIPHLAAAQQSLPLNVPPGGTYADTWLASRSPEDMQRIEANCLQALRSSLSAYNQEYRYRRADGEWRWLYEDVRIYPLESRRWRLVGVCTDITTRKRLEQQLSQAQKMEAVGRLAGGVAHDFNNLLTAILGYTRLLLEKVGSDQPLRRYLQEVESGGTRAASLVRQLLVFSRKQVPLSQVLDLNALMADMKHMLQPLIGEHITLRFDSGASLGRVKADPGQIEQIIVNLAVNARDAMPQGGKLTIATANETIGKRTARWAAEVPPGDYVTITVADTGAGMDAETRSHLFEPFFTTKDSGKGTGLGLFTVGGIVKQCGGYITVQSEPGCGTSFKIHLPRIEEPLPSTARSEENSKVPTGSETILIVEDEVVVRQAMSESLQTLGYTVLTASQGPEAIALAQRHPGRIQLVISDLVMPRMNGCELSEYLRALRPEARLLLISGYTDASPPRGDRLPADAAFMQKPILPDQLARRVRALLDAPR